MRGGGDFSLLVTVASVNDSHVTGIDLSVSMLKRGMGCLWSWVCREYRPCALIKEVPDKRSR